MRPKYDEVNIKNKRFLSTKTPLKKVKPLKENIDND